MRYFYPLISIGPIINNSALSCVQVGPHSHSTCMYFVCYHQAYNTPPPTTPAEKASYTGALFKRQRIDGNI